MIKWFKKLFEIVKNYDDLIENYEEFKTFQRNRNNFFEANIIELRQVIRERTDINVDVHHHKNKPCHIIMVGKFRNRDYVEIFDIHYDEFQSMLSHLHNLRKYGRLGRIDAAPQVHAVLEHELKP